MRDKSIDVAKGLAIILVMVGHTITNKHICNAIYSFHMPLFFILSGYFMNEKRIDKGYIIKLFKSLLLPYLLTAILTIFVSYLMNISCWNDVAAAFIVGCKFSKLEIPFIGAIWFLVALFLAKLIVQLIINGILRWEFLLLYATILFAISYLTGVILPYCISIIGFCSLFVLIGYIIKKYYILRMLLKAEYSMSLVFACLLFSPLVPLAVRINYYPLGLFNIVTASFISIAMLIFTKRMMETKVSKFMCELSWLGMNSLLVLCIHSIECHFHLLDLTNNEYLNCFIRIFIITILSFLLSKIGLIKIIFNTK